MKYEVEYVYVVSITSKLFSKIFFSVQDYLFSSLYYFSQFPCRQFNFPTVLGLGQWCDFQGHANSRLIFLMLN